ncbi:MAG: type II toxin-antitoxin system PemK/MazF family toxin [Balneolales bacterium]
MPSRGEIWDIAFYHAQNTISLPCLILSDELLKNTSANLTVVLPATNRDLNIASHIQAIGLEAEPELFIRCEEMLTVSTKRCLQKIGKVSDKTMLEVDETVKLLLGL